MLNLIIFGPPGAGKGTQSEKLINEYKLTHLSTGDILRNEIKNQTSLGIEAKKIIDKGELVPDDIVIGMIEHKLDEGHNTNGYIFDGFPRTIAQANALDSLMAKKNKSITAMIALEVEEEELVKRILLRGKDSGRTDDQDISIIRNRIVVYTRDTMPIMEFYKAQGKLIEVFGIGEIEDIFNSIVSQIKEHTK